VIDPLFAEWISRTRTSGDDLSEPDDDSNEA